MAQSCTRGDGDTPPGAAFAAAVSSGEAEAVVGWGGTSRMLSNSGTAIEERRSSKGSEAANDNDGLQGMGGEECGAVAVGGKRASCE